MVKEEKKKKQLRNRKETNSAKPWPDLPQPICDKISREANLLNKIYSKGATKSCLTKSSKCKTSNFSSTSWFQLWELDNGDEDDEEADSFSIRLETAPRCELHCVGWTQGYLVAKQISSTKNSLRHDNELGEYHMWYPSSDDPGVWRRGYIPSSHRLYRYKCAGLFFSSDFGYPYENECIALFLTGTSSPAFCSYRLKADCSDWRKHWIGCTDIVDPHCSNPYEKEHFMRITNVIGFRGKFYAVSLQGTLVVIEDMDSAVGITRMCSRRAVPSVTAKHYRECLVESEGRVLLVFLISRSSVQTVDDVEVYEIDDGDLKLKMSKCENIGDTALFLGANCCMAVSGRRVGCNGNCIYFTHCSADDWWVYDLKTDTISPIAWNQSK